MILKMLRISFIGIIVFSIYSCAFSFMTIKVDGVKTYMLDDIENQSNKTLSPFFDDGIISVINRSTAWNWSANPDLEIKIVVRSFTEEPKDYTTTGDVISYLYKLDMDVLCIKKDDTLLNKNMKSSILWQEGDDEEETILEMGKRVGEQILGGIGSDW